MLRTQRAADIAGGMFLCLLGIVVVLASLRIAGSPDVRLHPRTLPLILGWIIAAAGVILAAQAWRFRGENRIIKWPDRPGMVRVCVTLLSLTVYLALMESLGLPLSTTLYIGFLMWYLGRYRLLWAAALGLVSGATVYIVFIRLLQLSFPAGPLAR